MTWETIELNDGNVIPSIAFGTWKLGNGDVPITNVDQAISVGFSHIDTAQAYQNETETGTAIRESGLARSELFITTKYSGRDGLTIKQSIAESLKKLGVSYVDLYLIHHPRLAVPDIPTAWKEMEDIKEQGLAKSIGVSNFGVPELTILLASSKIKPAANQIELHPYVYAQQLTTVEYSRKAGIVVEGYSPLIPVTQKPGGPVDEPVGRFAAKYNVSPDQILLAWAKSKKVVVITSSSKKSRMEGYLNAGNIPLTKEEILEIDVAGARGPAIGFTLRRAEVYRMVMTLLFVGCVYYGLQDVRGIMSRVS